MMNHTSNQYFLEPCDSGIENVDDQNYELFEIDWNNKVRSLSSIKEEIDGSLFSLDIQNGEDNVYVAVGKRESTSMDALEWTLKHIVNCRSTFVYLIHVFPELHHIPSPRNLPKSQVNHIHVEMYMAQERRKRKDFLQKFIDLGIASKVKIDTVLIESDMVAESILAIIPNFNIRKLVLGIDKSGLRKLRPRRGNNGIVCNILHNAPEYCDVTIVCDGKEVLDEQIKELQAPSQSDDTSNSTPEENGEHFKSNSFCVCFQPRLME